MNDPRVVNLGGGELLLVDRVGTLTKLQIRMLEAWPCHYRPLQAFEQPGLGLSSHGRGNVISRLVRKGLLEYTRSWDDDGVSAVALTRSGDAVKRYLRNTRPDGGFTGALA